MKDHTDGFIVYSTRALFLVLFCSSSAMLFGASILISSITMGVLFVLISFGTLHLISKSFDVPVKFYSPVPIKLDKWHFVFYIVNGSRIISPEDLFLENLLK